MTDFDGMKYEAVYDQFKASLHSIFDALASLQTWQKFDLAHIRDSQACYGFIHLDLRCGDMIMTGVVHIHLR